jgi:short chain dehydrogenase
MGGVDILVNAAAKPGGQSRSPALAEITTDAVWADVNTNLLGYLRCAQAVAPGMVDRGWGRIISVSGLAARSTGSTIGSIRNVAVAAMTKNLADELGPSGVNETVVHPGTTQTEATPATIAALATAEGVDAADIAQRFARATTIGRMVDGTEVAAVVTLPGPAGLRGRSRSPRPPRPHRCSREEMGTACGTMPLATPGRGASRVATPRVVQCHGRAATDERLIDSVAQLGRNDVVPCGGSPQRQ